MLLDELKYRCVLSIRISQIRADQEETSRERKVAGRTSDKFDGPYSPYLFESVRQLEPDLNV